MKTFSGFLKGALVGAFMIGTALSASAQSPRKVLIEEATNASCAPCAAQNPIFHELLGRADIKPHVIPITIHWYFPGPTDPMYLTDKTMNTERVKYYGINGVPTSAVNGKLHTPTAGSGWYEGAPGDTAAMGKAVRAELAKNAGISPLTINVTYTKGSPNHTVKVDVSSIAAVSNNKKIRIAILQYEVNDANAGSNGETSFHYVMRKMLPDYKGQDFVIAAGETKTFESSFAPKTDWDASQLYAVAFVQDDFTKEVLQAGSNFGGTVTANLTPETNIYSLITRGGTQTKEVTVANPTNQDLKVNLSVNTEKSLLLDGWSASVSPDAITIPANSSKTVTLSVNAPENMGGYAQVVVTATPDVSGDGMFGTATEVTAAGFLAENTKYGVISIAGYSGSYYQTLLNSSYGSELAILPYDPAALSAFSSQMFDVTILALNDPSANSFHGVPLEIAGTLDLMPIINNSLAAGKNVAVFSNSGLYYAYDPKSPAISVTGTPGVKDFFSTIGIEYVSHKMRGTQTQQGIQLSPFTITGVAGDIIGKSIGTVQIANTNPGYNVYTDIIKLKPGSPSKSFMYYDNTASQIGGIRYESPSKGKLVYMTMGLEASGNAGQGFRDQTMNSIMEYFVGAAPAISMDVTGMVDFENVNLLGEKEMPVTIRSTGNQDLVISGINISGDNPMSFDVVETLSFPFTLAPGEEKVLTVRFTPMVKGDNTALLNITSNTGSDNVVILSGVGVDPNSVEPFTQASLEVLSVEVGPNPVVNAATVKYTVGGLKSQNVEFTLVDALGIQVLDLGAKTSTPGSHVMNFTTASLPAGNYRLVARSAETSVQIPVVIVR